MGDDQYEKDRWQFVENSRVHVAQRYCVLVSQRRWDIMGHADTGMLVD